MLILTLNCGSSSAKFQICDWEAKEILLVGMIERIGQFNTRLEISLQDGSGYEKKQDCENHEQALSWVIDEISRSGAVTSLEKIKAVGHRMLHGGEQFTKSTIINDETMRVFESLVSLGPLHMPPNISGVKAMQKALPQATHCAIMDTAWHQTMLPKTFMYAIPYEWYQDHKIRRYGFHGTSFLYTAKRAAALLGKKATETNLIIAHIGNGASMCAVKDGVCVDTTMGLTPLEGLVMGTRSGDIDPAIIPFMMDCLHCDPKDIDNYLNKNSGILGITGDTTDRRDVYEKCQQGDSRAKLAFDMECYRVRKQIGAYTAALGRVDAIIFTAGVGEMSPGYRKGMVDGLEMLGIRLNEEKNAISHSRNCETRISEDDSPVRIFVIPTDEELVMTADAVALMDGSYDIHTNFHYHFADASYENPARERNLLKNLKKNPGLKNIIARAPARP
ncbi:acetate kinase [Candidatus Haliotispira prima]|uniref:Acetate kinase n=1 Tax=Candidatus Haliotispira prima TaxID=3034016 RepID=A0ABY8MFW7_9SPIO|nr:acetate kinase [Candidatus Haliotispira prima]